MSQLDFGLPVGGTGVFCLFVRRLLCSLAQKITLGSFLRPSLVQIAGDAPLIDRALIGQDVYRIHYRAPSSELRASSIEFS